MQKERKNQYPIVLVHGFACWGRDEMLGVKYWGGMHDIQEDLKQYGYETHTAVVGPFSSNWDRACELYAQLVGGTVDYGAAHAEKYGHDRFGRTYPGLLKNWDGEHKIHLIGHSMGGQTVRVLTQLLKEGSQEEREYAKKHGVQLSPLFEGGKSWVHSVTTIATPNDGTTLADVVTQLIPAAQQIMGLAAAVSGNTNVPVYDFKLDQWGLKRKAGESFVHYADRVWNSGIWTNTKDISAWDLKPEGAKELNNWVKAQPDVYYFSYSGEATFRSLITGHHLPDLTMNKLITPFGIFLGCYGSDEKWWQNDGIVNTISMNGPKLGSTDEIVPYDGTPKIGKWNDMGIQENWDHADYIGLSLSYVLGIEKIEDFYRGVADMLGSLSVR